MLIRVLYTSKPAPGLDSDQLEALIAPIRERALKFNAERHLTGSLAYSVTCFAQALEGEEAEVEALMAVIAKDPRHSDFHLIDRREIRNRAFPDWAMAFTLAPDFSGAGLSARDLIRFLIEAAQHCEKVRAIPGFIPEDKNQHAA